MGLTRDHPSLADLRLGWRLLIRILEDPDATVGWVNMTRHRTSRLQLGPGFVELTPEEAKLIERLGRS